MYCGAAKRSLDASGAKTGDTIEMQVEPRQLPYETDREPYLVKGVLMEVNASSDGNAVHIKLQNGYNISVDAGSIKKLKVVGKAVEKKEIKNDLEKDASLPRIALLGTGGTIASYVDYRTGAVHPAVSPHEFLRQVPDLKDIANVEPEVLFSILSENVTPLHWSAVAEGVKKAFDGGVKGVVIAHGTDTMAQTAAALSFVLRDLPGPVVLVGSQRSSDRPSSDSVMNLVHAVMVASRTDIGEVVVVMHGSTSDGLSLIHRGTRVRKMHSSRRDAFLSINSDPVGFVKGDTIRLMGLYRKAAPKNKVSISGGFEGRVLLLQAQPSLDPKLLSHIEAAYNGLIISGTGLGHVNAELTPILKEMTGRGFPIAMTTNCINGPVDMKVYSTGRDLLDAGLIGAGGMVPETAQIKMMWAIFKASEEGRPSLERIQELFNEDIAGEREGSTSPWSFGIEYAEMLRRWGFDQ